MSFATNCFLALVQGNCYFWSHLSKNTKIQLPMSHKFNYDFQNISNELRMGMMMQYMAMV
jgi:hypothetical protein